MSTERLTGTVTPKQNVTGQLARAEHVGGTRNYPDLLNKPSIEGVELVGNKTLDELNIGAYLRDYPSESQVIAIVNTAIGQIAIPVNTSDLVNDSDFQTGDDVIDAIAGAISGLDIPTRTSELINDSNYQTSDDVDGAIDKALEDLSIPTKTSDLTNDSGFQTANDVDTAIGTAISSLDIPEKVSDLTNDSGYQTAANVSDAINTAVGQLDIPTKVSDLTNDSGFQTALDVQSAIASADIPTNLSDLTNDMTFQTLTEITNLINDAIGSAVGLNFEVVQTLPASGQGGTIYLVPNGGSAVVKNVYDEYVWYNGAWEKIGTTEIDLTGYIRQGSTYQNNKALMTDANGNAITGDTTATELGYVHGVTSAIQTQLNGKQDTLTFDNVPTENSNNPVKSGGIYSALTDKVDKVTGKGLSKNDYTDADKAIVDGVTSALASKANASDVPTALSDLTDDSTHRLVSDTEKAAWDDKADISDIPTDLADLADDSTHRLVTDTEKTAWNNKADVSDIPTKTSDLTNDSGFATTTDLADKQDVIQYDTMPAASATNEGDIVQFTGTTTASYTTGYFYQCKENSGSYSWVQTDVQPSGGGSGDVSQSEIAPVETTSTASKAYASGDLLVYNGTLYRVTSDIASGETIVTTGVNANCTETSVAEVITDDRVQYNIMPTASVDNLGDIVQYIGVTTGSYTNGYFYKCDGISGAPLPYNFTGGSTVVYNGEIHILGGSSNNIKHYKWDGEEWVSVSTLPYEFWNACAVVYDNEIHILGSQNTSYRTAHYKWNSTNGWTEASTLPYFSFCEGLAVVYDNEIHILSDINYQNSEKHYKWDGEEWTSVSTLPHSGAYHGSAVVLNNEIHILGGEGGFPVNKAHYKWDGEEWTSVSTLPYEFKFSSAVVYNGEIHILGSSVSGNTTKHYKWDGEEWTSVSTLPYSFKYGDAIVYINEIHILGGNESNTGTNHYGWNGTEWISLMTSHFGWTRIDVQPSSGGGNYVQKTGDTMTGDLTVPNLTATGDITDGQGNSLKGSNSNLAPIEPTTTASQAYGVGDYLVYGGQLYKVTSAITNGGTIVPTGSGANVVATTVAENLDSGSGASVTLTATISGTTVAFSSNSIKADSILEGPYILNGFNSFTNATYSSSTNTVTYTLADNSCSGLSAKLIVK